MSKSDIPNRKLVIICVYSSCAIVVSSTIFSLSGVLYREYPANPINPIKIIINTYFNPLHYNLLYFFTYSC